MQCYIDVLQALVQTSTKKLYHGCIHPDLVFINADCFHFHLGSGIWADASARTQVQPVVKPFPFYYKELAYTITEEKELKAAAMFYVQCKVPSRVVLVDIYDQKSWT
jgi:hypothetical protein